MARDEPAEPGRELLLVPTGELSKMFSHASSAAPEECCGFLIGRPGRSTEVLEARRATNAAEVRRSQYLVDPSEHLHVELEFRGARRGVVGVYHSHVGIPAEPSHLDLDRAWPEYVYVIVEVRGSRAVGARAFRMDPAARSVREVPIAAPDSEGRATHPAKRRRRSSPGRRRARRGRSPTSP